MHPPGLWRALARFRLGADGLAVHCYNQVQSLQCSALPKYPMGQSNAVLLYNWFRALWVKARCRHPFSTKCRHRPHACCWVMLLMSTRGATHSLQALDPPALSVSVADAMHESFKSPYMIVVVGQYFVVPQYNHQYVFFGHRSMIGKVLGVSAYKSSGDLT